MGLLLPTSFETEVIDRTDGYKLEIHRAQFIDGESSIGALMLLGNIDLEVDGLPVIDCQRQVQEESADRTLFDLSFNLALEKGRNPFDLLRKYV